MAKTFQLVLQKGPGPGQVFTLEKDEITIGRDIECDISIIESSLSRRHARLFMKDGNYFLEDLNSTNGTIVNGTRISEPLRLATNTVFNLGRNIEFLYEALTRVEESTALHSRDFLKSVVPTGRTSKVFISYSRRNKEFVEKLHAGLTSTGINTWVDWKGIPLTADWWAEIEDAIEGADGFIFVISPDSLASEICGKELQTAIDYKKRLIPVLHIEPEPGSDMPEQISSHNWVFMKDEAGMHEMLPRLVESINTDLGYVQAHTRLLTRAVEWERKERNASFLLQGDDLQSAENWLDRAADNQPQPTDLQIEYIQVSRRHANRRQRIIMGATLTALAVTFVLAVVSFSLYLQANSALNDAEIARETAIAAQAEAETQANIARTAEADAVNEKATAVAAEQEANTQREAAEAAQEEAFRQAEKAYAGEVSATALTLIETNPPLAALLALNARRISPDDPTAIETLSLLPAFYPPLVDAIEDPNGWVSELAWSPSGQLASATWNELGGEVLIWNLDSREPEQVLQGHTGTVIAMAWSADGRLATGSDTGEIIVWDQDTGQPDIVLPVYQNGISGLAWSPRGALASTSMDGWLIIWDLERQDYDQWLEYDFGLSSVAWNPVGGLVTGADDGKTLIWNTATWEIDIAYEDHQSGVLSVSVNRDGRVATSSKDGTVAVRNMFGGQAEILRGHTDWVNVVAWSDDGRLASGSWDDTVIVWDLATGEPARILRGHNGSVESLSWGPDGQLASGVDFIFLWDLNQEPAMRTFQGHLDWVYDMLWLDEFLFLTSSGDGKVLLWDAESGVFDDLGFNNYGSGMDFSSTSLLAAGSVIIDTNTGLDFIVNGEKLAFSPDGQYMIGRTFGDVNEFAIWEVEPLIFAGEIVSETLTIDEEVAVTSFAWGPDGSVFATGASDGTILLWDFASKVVIGSLDQHFEAVTDLYWKDDGRLVSAGADKFAYIWETNSMTIEMELEGAHESGLTAIDWGPGEWLATADSSGRIVVWNAAAGNVNTIIRAPYKRSVNDVAWSPDGRVLAFGGNSFNVYLFNTKYAPDPCNWLVRNMSEGEWSFYIYDEDFNPEYHPTCSNLP